MNYPVDDFEEFWSGTVKFVTSTGTKAENGDDIYVLKSRTVLLMGDPEKQIEDLSDKIEIIEYDYEPISKTEFKERFDDGKFVDHRLYNRMN